MTRPIKIILAIATLTGTLNLAYYQWMDFSGLPTDTTSLLAFVSLIVLAVAVYFALVRIQLSAQRLLPWYQNLAYGMAVVIGASLVIIFLRILTTLLSLSKYESLSAYFESGAISSTLFWYSAVGLIYCLVAHCILWMQKRKKS